jgi:hypothetical protein
LVPPVTKAVLPSREKSCSNELIISVLLYESLVSE